MEARWLFTCFDWRRFHDISARVLTLQLGAEADLADMDGAAAVLDEMGDDAPPEAIRNAVLVELCTTCEGALFESGLPELISWLRRQQSGEEPAETLAELISACPGVQSWFAAESGLVGLLTIDATSELARLLGIFRNNYQRPSRKRGLAALTKHFSTTEPAAEHLEELMEVVNDAAAEMLGLAVIRVA